jgi:hypothetical protein
MEQAGMDEVEILPCDAEEVGTDEEEAETRDVETGDAETEDVETIEGFPTTENVETMEQAGMNEVKTMDELHDTDGVETMEHLHETARVATLKHLPGTGEASGISDALSQQGYRAVHQSEVETIDTPFDWGSVGDIEATKQLPLPPPSFPCRWAAGSCAKTFPDKGQLLDHLRAVHHPKRAQCPACWKGFAYQCDVRRHYERKHKDAPPLCWPVKPNKRPRN